MYGALSGRQSGHDLTLLELLSVAGKQRRLLVDTQLARSEVIMNRANARRIDVRVYGRSLRRMFVFDGRCAVVPVDQVDWAAGALLLRAPLAGPCGELFDFQWAASRPLTIDSDCCPGLSGRQLEVIYLLLQGATDHQVAHQIGVSSRTVRSVVSQLQRRFGTTSRMALGFQLACNEVIAPEFVEHRG
ncbi:helix-turn-helix transcriptional regulator [Amycolatopsis anabasis]|uniref:helix-turn-helix transcriptional regulator n=1 Tax=Amycolatopsis anabasis TaxID=1840409 RepID=UPI00131ECF1E|nr:LuxR C-terminal-related transcriptional regulator [Amycolatopsis anabasis]